MLRGDYNFEVIDVAAENFDYSLKVLRTRDVKMVVTEHSDLINGLSLLEHLPSESSFICTNAEHPEVQSIKEVVKFERKQALAELKKHIETNFEIDRDAEIDEFTAVPFKALVAFPSIADHVFIQLPTGRRLKLYQKGDKILPADVERYANKGVNDLWLNKNAYLWVLKKMKENFESMVDDEDFSFDEDDFDFDMESSGGIEGLDDISTLADEIKKKSSGPGGTLDYDQMFGKNKKPRNKDKYEMSADSDLSMDDLDRELAELDAGYQDNPFTKEQEFLKEVNNKVQTVLKKVSKNRNMAALFRQLKINREEGSYIKTRINLVVHLTTTIAKELQWASPATFEKLIYVAHVHDIALFEKPILAKAQSVIDLEIIKGITEEDKKHFLPHVEKAVALIKADPWAPEGADKIVEQHHEKPDRSGFPNQLTHQRIVPFAALLAISIDCAQYMIDNQNWDIATWVDKNEKKWKGGSYTKVMGGLKKLATQMEKAS